MPFTLGVNSQAFEVDVPEGTPPLWVIRDELKLTGTMFGCGVASCDACIVHVDGEPTRSCASYVKGAEIPIMEGVASEVAGAVRQPWNEMNVVHCGYFQPGQIMPAIGLLSGNRPRRSKSRELHAGQCLPLRHLPTHPRRRSARIRNPGVLNRGRAAYAKPKSQSRIEAGSRFTARPTLSR